ncbi:asparagine synthase-related protein, partial [Thalassobaculum salexigens]
MLAECARQALDPVTSLLALERRTYMVSLLQRMDRMSMAVGLECRVPLM